MKHVVAKPRHLGKHVREVVDHLQKVGASDIVFIRGRHIRLEFSSNGQKHFTRMSGTPRDGDTAAFRTIRRIDHLIASGRRA